MKNLLLVFTCLLAGHAYGQEAKSKIDIHYGPSVSYGYTMHSEFKSKTFVPVVSLGGFANAKISKKISVNAGVNVSAFGKYSRSYDMAKFDFQYDILTLRDSIGDYYRGEINYEGIYLSFPIRTEFFFTKSNRVGFMLGFTPRFRLYEKSSWDYTILAVNKNTRTIINESSPYHESPTTKFFHSNPLHIGFIFKIKKLKITPIANVSQFTFVNTSGPRSFGGLDFTIEFNWELSYCK